MKISWHFALGKRINMHWEHCVEFPSCSGSGRCLFFPFCWWGFGDWGQLCYLPKVCIQKRTTPKSILHSISGSQVSLHVGIPQEVLKMTQCCVPFLEISGFIGLDCPGTGILESSPVSPNPNVQLKLRIPVLHLVASWWPKFTFFHTSRLSLCRLPPLGPLPPSVHLYLS